MAKLHEHSIITIPAIMFTAISTPTPFYRCGDSVIIVILILISIKEFGVELLSCWLNNGQSTASLLILPLLRLLPA